MMTEFEEKTTILKEKFFFSSSQVNLTDINFTTYSSPVRMKTAISKKKVEKVI